MQAKRALNNKDKDLKIIDDTFYINKELSCYKQSVTN